MNRPASSNPFAAAQPAMADVTLTRDDMKFIATLVYEQAGIVIREHKEAMTRGRLARRVKALGMNSVAEYCAFLKTPQAAGEGNSRWSHVRNAAVQAGQPARWRSGCPVGSSVNMLKAMSSTRRPLFLKVSAASRIIASMRGMSGWQ